MTPHEAAKDLIAFYVRRGDALHDLKQSHMCTVSSAYWASIGGLGTDNRHYGTDKIVVNEVERKRVHAVFPLKAIYNEIRRSSSQPALF